MRSITLFTFLLIILATLGSGCVENTQRNISPNPTLITTDIPSPTSTEIAFPSEIVPPSTRTEIVNPSEATPPHARTEVAIPVEAMSLVNQAINNLVSRFGVPKDKIAILIVEVVDWPDTSLGCPQPGIVYAEVITPGFRILLQAEKVVYDYHTDDINRVILCQARGPDDIYPTP